MNKEMIQDLVKKTGLNEGQINDAVSFVQTKLQSGEADSILSGLTSKFNLPGDAAKGILDAVSGALGGGIVDSIKGFLGM